MPTTTVLSEDAATIVSTNSEADTPQGRFSWSSAFAGALVATAVTFFLLTLGSGVGLSLVSVHGSTAGGRMTFLTLGAIYFLTAQAFGFAAGGMSQAGSSDPRSNRHRKKSFAQAPTALSFGLWLSSRQGSLSLFPRLSRAPPHHKAPS